MLTVVVLAGRQEWQRSTRTAVDALGVPRVGCEVSRKIQRGCGDIRRLAAAAATSSAVIMMMGSVVNAAGGSCSSSDDNTAAALACGARTLLLALSPLCRPSRPRDQPRCAAQGARPLHVHHVRRSTAREHANWRRGRVGWDR